MWRGLGTTVAWGLSVSTLITLVLIPVLYCGFTEHRERPRKSACAEKKRLITMKAIFIAYNQAYNQEIVELLEGLGQRGYTVWEEVGGRGSVDGEPHLATMPGPRRTMPSLPWWKTALAPKVMEALRETDAAQPALGLRAYVLPVDEAM